MAREMNEEGFSIVKRAKSFTHAGRGVWLLLKTTHNAWIHLTILFLAVVAGVFLDIPRTDWGLLFVAAGLVLTAEGVNTAIEIDMDLTSPDYHPFARDTKDVAAGAVLISALAAVCVGVVVFGPYLLAYLKAIGVQIP